MMLVRYLMVAVLCFSAFVASIILMPVWVFYFTWVLLLQPLYTLCVLLYSGVLATVDHFRYKKKGD